MWAVYPINCQSLNEFQPTDHLIILTSSFSPRVPSSCLWINPYTLWLSKLPRSSFHLRPINHHPTITIPSLSYFLSLTPISSRPRRLRFLCHQFHKEKYHLLWRLVKMQEQAATSSMAASLPSSSERSSSSALQIEIKEGWFSFESHRFCSTSVQSLLRGLLS